MLDRGLVNVSVSGIDGTCDIVFDAEAALRAPVVLKAVGAGPLPLAGGGVVSVTGSDFPSANSFGAIMDDLVNASDADVCEAVAETAQRSNQALRSDICLDVEWSSSSQVRCTLVRSPVSQSLSPL